MSNRSTENFIFKKKKKKKKKNKKKKKKKKKILKKKYIYIYSSFLYLFSNILKSNHELNNVSIIVLIIFLNNFLRQHKLEFFLNGSN